MCFVFSIFICSGGKNAPSWVVVRRYAPWKSKSASGLWFAAWGCSQVAQGLSVKRTGSLGVCPGASVLFISNPMQTQKSDWIGHG